MIRMVDLGPYYPHRTRKMFPIARSMFECLSVLENLRTLKSERGQELS